MKILLDLRHCTSRLGKPLQQDRNLEIVRTSSSLRENESDNITSTPQFHDFDIRWRIDIVAARHVGANAALLQALIQVPPDGL